jgi:hypothetical protein
MFYGDLIQRLKVDMTILDYNYIRLNKYMRMLLYEQIRIFNLRPYGIQLIDEKEYPLALEFFLQFDGMFDNDITVKFVIFMLLFLWFLYSKYVLYENMFISFCSTSYIE